MGKGCRVSAGTCWSPQRPIMFSNHARLSLNHVRALRRRRRRTPDDVPACFRCICGGSCSWRCVPREGPTLLHAALPNMPPDRLMPPSHYQQRPAGSPAWFKRARARCKVADIDLKLGCPFRRCRSRRERWRRIGLGSVRRRSSRLFRRFWRGVGCLSSFGRRSCGVLPCNTCVHS